MMMCKSCWFRLWMYLFVSSGRCSAFFFFNDTATTEIYTLSLHDALPISRCTGRDRSGAGCRGRRATATVTRRGDRKSTRLNSSHSQISYAVFCLKKKKDRREPHEAPSSLVHVPSLHEMLLPKQVVVLRFQ